ncbi:MAG: histidine kinase [Negativicutes bacterium]|jgi:sensor histidine kinase YesM
MLQKTKRDQYLQYFHDEDLKCFAVQVVTAIILSCAFSGYDIATIGITQGVILVAGFRLFFGLALGLLLVVFWKNIYTSYRWDAFAATVFTILALASYMLSTIRAAGYPDGSHEMFAVVNVIYIIGYFSMIPIENNWLRMMPAVGFVLVIAVEVMIYFRNTGLAIFTVVICILASVLGAYLSFRSVKRRHKIFDQYLRELEAKKQLEQKHHLEKQLVQAENLVIQYEAELKLLNSQIKPHFLYNAISTAIVLCRSKPGLAATALEKLVVYLQGATNSDLGVTSVSGELKVVEAYLDIQQIRMDERLRFEIHRNYSTDIEIPVYAIQTLVENSVIHGLQNCENGGKIIITVSETPGRLCVTVQDNGVGTDAEKFKFLNDERPEESDYFGKRSIGMWNVNRRLKIMGSTGLSAQTHKEAGTKIRFELPIHLGAGG